MDKRLHLSDRFSPEVHRAIDLMLFQLNELRRELGLDAVTPEQMLDYIRAQERLARAEKERV